MEEREGKKKGVLDGIGFRARARLTGSLESPSFV